MTDAPTPALQCRATTAAGAQCRQTNTVDPATGLCLLHDPARKEEAQAARDRGNEKRRKNEPRTVSPEDLPGGPPETLDDVVRWSSWVAWAAASGKIDARTARETSYALQTLRYGLEKRDLGREVADLRAQLKALQKGAAA